MAMVAAIFHRELSTYVPVREYELNAAAECAARGRAPPSDILPRPLAPLMSAPLPHVSTFASDLPLSVFLPFFPFLATCPVVSLSLLPHLLPASHPLTPMSLPPPPPPPPPPLLRGDLPPAAIPPGGVNHAGF